jgi:flavorubredoxin
MNTPTRPPKIFREYAPGCFWFGGCLVIDSVTPALHSHMNAYLIVGSERSVLIDTGHPKDWADTRESLQAALGDRPLDFLLPTHQEYPHAGNLEDLLNFYPYSQVIGNTNDYHAYVPGVKNRVLNTPIGTILDLGGRELVILPAPIRDLATTNWAYDTGSQSLFVSDGFSYSHQHEAHECALMSTELDWEPSAEDIVYVNQRALHWTKFVESDPLFDEVESMVEKHPTRFICPAHGNVISNPEAIIDSMREMTREVSERWAAANDGAA